MLGKKQWLIDDAKLIVSEFERIAPLIGKDFKNIPRDDMWFSVPASPFGEWIVGKAAGRSLERLAEEAGRRVNLTQRVEPDTLNRPMRKLFSEWFLQKKLCVEIGRVEKILSLVGKVAQKECKTITHIVPCHLMTVSDPDEFSVGPVRFRNKKRLVEFFWKNFESRLFKITQTGAST